MKCSTCTKAEAKPGAKTCQPCIDKAVIRRRGYDAARGGPRKRERPLNLPCMRCKINARAIRCRLCDECRAVGEYRYSPIDLQLRVAHVHLLRYLRRFDWVSTFDLLETAGVDTDREGRHNRAARGAIQRMLRLGLAERHGTPRHGYLYRITDAGRAAYQSAITVRLDVASDAEAGEVPWDWRSEAA